MDFTDNEIKKALECCSYGSELMCQECPADDCSLSCGNKLAKQALDLINRKDAEIDELKHNEDVLYKAKEQLRELAIKRQAEIERLRHEYSNAVLTIKSKDSFIEYLKEYAKERKIEEIENRGIKKFSRRLQGELKKRRKMSNSLTEKTMIGYFLIDIDNLVKEMTEVSK